MMVTSDFRPEVEIRLFRTCAMINIQNNPYLWPNHQNFHVLKEIGVDDYIIIGTVCSMGTWLWGRCHILQDVF